MIIGSSCSQFVVSDDINHPLVVVNHPYLMITIHIGRLKFFLLSSYMEYIESIGLTPKILKFFFDQIMLFTDKKS
jgi:hypothetical protein